MLFDRLRAVAELVGRVRLERFVVQHHREAPEKRAPFGFVCHLACCGVISRHEFIVPDRVRRAPLSSAPDRVASRNSLEEPARFLLPELIRHGLEYLEHKTPSLSTSKLFFAWRFGRYCERADHREPELVRRRAGGREAFWPLGRSHSQARFGSSITTSTGRASPMSSATRSATSSAACNSTASA